MNTLRVSRGAAIDFLVLLLALVLFLAWALGSVYLSYFPSSRSSAATSSAGTMDDGNSAIGSNLGISDDAGPTSDTSSTDSETDSGSEGSSSNDDGGSSSSGGGAFDPSNSFAAGGSSRSSGSNEFTLSDQQKQEISSSFDKKLDMRLNQLRSGLDTKFAKLESNRQSLTAPAPVASAIDPGEIDGIRSEIQRLSDELQNQSKQAETTRLELFNKQTAMEQLQQEILSLKQEIETNSRVANSRVANNPILNNSVINSLTPESNQATTNDLDAYLFRDWTGTNGKVIEMAFIRQIDGFAEFIDRQKTPYRCKISQLSEKDQDFIRALRDNR